MLNSDQKIHKFRTYLRVPEKGDRFFISPMLSPAERSAAHQLLWNRYVKLGFWSEDDENTDKLYFHKKAETACFMISEDSMPLGTISVFPDGEEGLPLDNVFSEEIESFRFSGRKIVEAGALVTSGSNPYILHSLLKIVLDYSLQNNVDDIFLTVNPKHLLFYQALFCMQKIGEFKSHPGVNGFPAVLLRMDLHSDLEKMKESFPREPKEMDLYSFYCPFKKVRADSNG